MKNKKYLVGALSAVLFLGLVGCGQDTVNKIENVEENIENKIDETGEKIENKVDSVLLDKDSQKYKDQEAKTIERVGSLGEDIIKEKFNGDVIMESFDVQVEQDDPKDILMAEFSFVIDIEDLEEAKRMIDFYSDGFKTDFDKREDFESLDLKWTIKDTDYMVVKSYKD